MSEGWKRRPHGGQFGNRLFYAALALLLGIVLFIRLPDETPQRYPVLDLAEHPLGSATPYVPHARRFPAFYVVRTKEDQVFALVRLAPASGCLVVWNEELEAFEDPCTKQTYGWDGTALGDEEIPGLLHLPVERSEIDMIRIDLGTRLPNPFDQKGS